MQKLIPSSRSLVVVLLLVSAGVLFFRLDRNKLQSWDEAVYAESAKEMAQGGDWLTPHWNQEPFYQKPPLAIWMTAILFRWIGVNELNARAFSAVCGVACIVLTFLIAASFLPLGHAFLAALVLLVTPHFNYYARQGLMDVPLTAFLLLAIYSYIRSRNNKRWWLLVGCAFGLAVLTKGVAAGPGILAVATVVAFARERSWRVREFWIGVILFFVIAGSWHLAMLLVHGRAFVAEYIGGQVLSRSVSTFDTNPLGPAAYVKIAVLGFLPFTPFLIAGGITIWKTRRFSVSFGLLSLFVFLLYSLVPTKHPWYMVPVYPALAAVLCSVKRIPYVLAAVLIIGAAIYCWMLDATIPSLHPAVPGVVEQARKTTGPLNVPIDIAPAVLFYTDRKICTDAPHHSMGQLTRCGQQ
jgi:4-amino-4-deoxy-L-arabinose transferase-like glycosyltransferase